MKTNYFAVACIGLVSPLASAQALTWTITENGYERTLYVHPDSSNASLTIENGSELEYGADMRLNLTNSESPDDHYKPNLLGGVVEYDVDLSDAGCGCISELSSVLMPALDDSEEEPRGYCNASDTRCPGFNFMQANSKAFHSESRSCNSQGCQGTCILDVKHAQPQNSYGEGWQQYKINTRRPFHVKIDFEESNEGNFTGYMVTLTQGWKEVVMNSGNCNHLRGMTDDIQQMALNLRSWHGSRNELNQIQHDKCGQNSTCSLDSFKQTISNLSIKTHEAAQADPTPASGYPPLKITENDTELTLYVQSMDQNVDSFVMDGQTGVDFALDKRMYLSLSPSLDTSKFYSPNLLGGALEYDVDLSNVSCGCVSSVSVVGMPAVDNWRDPFQYCNANRLNDPRGHLCPEFDIMQANGYAFQSEAHRCEAPVDGVYSRCHQSNCSVNTSHVRPLNAYGKGASYRINTEEPFHVKMDFLDQNDQFMGYTLTLSQNDQSVEISAGSCTASMTEDIKNMALVLSSWEADDLNWMQNQQCSGRCQRNQNQQQISNIRITTTEPTEILEPLPPQFEFPPVQDQQQFVYGDRCTEADDRSRCGSNQSDCHKSYPDGDVLEWESPRNKCRRLPRQRSPFGYEYGEQCSSPSAGSCDGSCNCKESWPKDAPSGAASHENMCRCEPSQEERNDERKRSYGGECGAKYVGYCGADCHKCQWNWFTDGRQPNSDGKCRCQPEQIREVIWGEETCPSRSDGQCGTHCRDCRKSWEVSDTDGSTIDCRCKNWHGND